MKTHVRHLLSKLRVRDRVTSSGLCLRVGVGPHADQPPTPPESGSGQLGYLLVPLALYLRRN